MSAAESDNFLVIESHTIEDLQKTIRLRRTLKGPRQQTNLRFEDGPRLGKRLVIDHQE
jgi:hypothetical protein